MRKVKVAIDCDIPQALAAMLTAVHGDRGFEFMHVSTIVPPKTEDEVWADAFKRFGGEITLSADKNIIRKPHKAVAFLDNGFKAFFMQPPWSMAPGHVKLAHLTFWWPAIARFAEDSGPGCWQVPFRYKDGTLSLRLGDFKPLRLPDIVLDAARRQRAAPPADSA